MLNMIQEADNIRGWKLVENSVDENQVKKISEEFRLLPLTAKIMCRRGCDSVEKIDKYIFSQSSKIPDPFLLPDMKLATDRIINAINNKEKIVVYGDYDVDGITSVGTLVAYLSEKGADVGYYIPSRIGDGYGVNNNAIDKLVSEGMKLLITVDTGVTACEEADYCKSLGIDMIVTDHHECHCDLPKCYAVINPMREDSDYPFRELAGVGVVFKLICAIESTIKGFDSTDYILDNYSDLICIGTVSDVMPLVEENRIIVKKGLSVMEKKPRPGISSLLEKAGKQDNVKIDVALISFAIAPRLNAAGRMEDATDALRLLLAQDSVSSNKLATLLCEINLKRQEEERKIADDVSKMIAEKPELLDKSTLVLSSDNWHHGVIGIVASRLSETYHKPVILITFDGDKGKGSGRSVKGINLVNALSSCSNYLVRFGGHELAAGLTVEKDKLDIFIDCLNDYVLNNPSSFDTKSISVDFEVDSSDICMRQAEEMTLLEPYGVGNKEPLFVIREVIVKEINEIGNGKHSKLLLQLPNCTYDCQAVYFGKNPAVLGIEKNDIVDIVFNLSINEYMGRKNVQMTIRSISYHSEQIVDIHNDMERCNDLSNGVLCGKNDCVPTRNEFISVYRCIKDWKTVSQYITLKRIKHYCKTIDSTKILLIMKILKEKGLISYQIESKGMCIFNYSICESNIKVNLEDSPTYLKLKQIC